MMDSELRMAALPKEKTRASLCLMDHEIRGTQVYCHVLPKTGTLILLPSREYVRILFVCSGSVAVQSNAETREFAGRGVYIGAPTQTQTVTARTDARILEICRWLTQEEQAALENAQLPYGQDYAQAHCYMEDCKSAKTVSRMLVPQRLIPGFAMGSVETYGEDRIEKHTHPLVEQFFFGLEENDCILMIGDREYAFPDHTLLHIPLGSDHGIRLEEQHSCHYLWMDFLLNEEALQYMDEAHKIVVE